MNHALFGDEKGLVGYWNFNNLTEDGRIPDLSGNGNHGILMYDAHLAESWDGPIR